MRSKGFVDKIKAFYRQRDDTELQQATVRLIIAIISVLYFGNYSDANGIDAGALIALVFLTFSLLLFSFVFFSTTISPARRMVGIVGDLSATTVCMALAGESGAVLVGMYLWVSLANGFRYGHRYLYTATLLGVVGFAAVLQISPYWQAHLSLAAGILALLLVLPIYVSKLVKQLENARTRAEEANRIKSQFLANMSHELRTPLHGVLGVADLLGATPLTEEQVEYVKVISDSARTLVALVTDVLDMSKIEAGKLKVERIPFDFHGLLNSTLKLLKPQADKKGLYLHCHVDPSFEAHLRGDPLHIRQVLTNLISNAIKFTSDGGIDVYVDVISQSSSAALLKIRVVDTGIGISPAFRAKIFDDFTQADESTTRRFGGTGLGTAISRRLVELMGGQIGVNSMLGKGSEFWFDLPLEKTPKLDEPCVEPAAHCRVLIVSSKPSETRLADWLSGWNMISTFVSQQTELFDALEASLSQMQPYDAVLIHGDALFSDPRDLAKEIWATFPTTSLNLIFCREAGTMLPSAQDLAEAGYACTLPAAYQKPLLFNALHAASSHESFPADVAWLHARRSDHTARLRVLVAEDNATNQMVIKKLLEKAGHVVELVGNGEEALTALSERFFDVAIFDMQMPIMGGVEAAKIYRFETPQDRRVPIVILTANATADARAQCEDAGVSLYLSKPLDSAQLIESVNLLASGSSSPTLPSDAGFSREPNRDPDSTASTLLNYQVLENLTELFGKASLPQLVDQFTRDTQLLLSNMESLADGGSIREFADMAHALKGSAGSIGATKMYDDCLAAERADGANATKLLLDLKQSFTATRHAIRVYLTQIGIPSRSNSQG